MRAVVASSSWSVDLPLATPGWLETTTTLRPSSLRALTAAAAPGWSWNWSGCWGESMPAGVTTMALMTPSRSRKAALCSTDALPQLVHDQVVEADVDALDDRG